MSEPPKTARGAALQRHAQRYLELKQGLQNVEYFCKGTVLKRMMKCGKPNCACRTDPDKRHGPYWEMTYKASAKTVNQRLSAEAAPIYRAASQQYRKLKKLLTRLETLSRTVLAAEAKRAESVKKRSRKEPAS